MNSKQLQFVTAEQGDRLRAAGFDWEVDYYFEKATGLRLRSHQPQNFNNDWVAHRGKVSAPTVALALKWMRDMKRIDCCVMGAIQGCITVTYYGAFKHRGDSKVNHTRNKHNTYEAAESALLDELLTLIGK